MTRPLTPHALSCAGRGAVGQADDVALAVAAASVLRSLAVTVRPASLATMQPLQALSAAVVASVTSGADQALASSARAAHLLSPQHGRTAAGGTPRSATSSPAALKRGTSGPTALASPGVRGAADTGAAEANGTAGVAQSWRRSAMLALVSAWALPLHGVRDEGQGWDVRRAGLAALLEPFVTTLRQMVDHPEFVTGGYCARKEGARPYERC